MSLVSALKQSAYEHIVAVSIGGILAALAGLLTWAWPSALQQIADAILSKSTPKQLLTVVCISLLANAILAASLISSRSAGPRLRPRYGVYWDKDGNSYCPKCKMLMSQIAWATYNNGQWHGLRCSCTQRPFVLLEAGQPIHVQDAMRQINR